MIDVAYIEAANGRFEAWTYSDGSRVYIGKDHDRANLAARLRSQHYRVVHVR